LHDARRYRTGCYSLSREMFLSRQKSHAEKWRLNLRALISLSLTEAIYFSSFCVKSFHTSGI
jgi:hypothetical protein